MEETIMGEQGSAPALPAWRFALGITAFISAFAVYLITAAVILAGASAKTIGTVAAINFALNKVFLVTSAVLLGKPGFIRLKKLIVGKLHRHLMPDDVGPWRYRIGLVMFSLPLLFAWKAPYVTALMPLLGRHSVETAVVTDVLFVASLFVLGGSFWDKLRALFVRQATVVFPPSRGDRP